MVGRHAERLAAGAGSGELASSVTSRKQRQSTGTDERF